MSETFPGKNIFFKRKSSQQLEVYSRCSLIIESVNFEYASNVLFLDLNWKPLFPCFVGMVFNAKIFLTWWYKYEIDFHSLSKNLQFFNKSSVFIKNKNFHFMKLVVSLHSSQHSANFSILSPRFSY